MPKVFPYSQHSDVAPVGLAVPVQLAYNCADAFLTRHCLRMDKLCTSTTGGPGDAFVPGSTG